MFSPVSILALVEALATASATTLAIPAYKNSRFLGPCRIGIERAGTTGGGTVYGAYLPGPSSDPAKYQEAQGDGSTVAFATSIPYAALSNNNFVVRVSKSGRTNAGAATAAVTAASKTVTGTSTAFTTELRIGDQIEVNGERRRVVAIASDTSLTVNEAFVNSASGKTLYLIDGFLAPTTDFTVSDVGGFATITAGHATKVPNGCKIEIMFITPVALFAFATATVQFKKLELGRGADLYWYVSDSTTSPSATTIYVEPVGE